MPKLNVFGIVTFDFSQPRTQTMMLLLVFGILTLLIANLKRSKSGRAALAVRSSPVAARTSGIGPAKSEIMLFALAAGIAGFGGVMLGMTNGFVSNTTATPITGLLWLAVVVTFGIRRPGGALLGGLAVMATTPIFQWISGFSFMPSWFNDLTASTYFASIMFGLGAINLAKNPDGLFALIGDQRAERRRKRERAAHIELAEEQLHAVPGANGSGATPLPLAAPSAPGRSGPVAKVPVPVIAVTEVTLPEPAAPAAVSDADAGLTIDDVVAGYDDVEVLHGVSLRIGRGSVVALVGPNGAGKSTLCSTVAGLVVPTRGRIVVGERDVTALASFERARSGVMLAPEARGIFPGLTVEENLTVLLRSAPLREQAYERFPILGQRRRQIAGLLSGGEQQMLSLAPALANPPAVFVADEPTLGLAPLAAETVMGAVAELRDLGSAVLLVEEKAREVLEVADIVAFMELGRIGWVGHRDQIDEEQLAATYLGAVTT